MRGRAGGAVSCGASGASGAADAAADGAIVLYTAIMNDGQRPGFRSVLHLGRTLRLVWSIAPGWTVASALLAVVQGLLPLAGLLVLRVVINAVQAGAKAPDKAAAFRHVVALIVIAGVIGVIAALARSVSQLVSEAQGQVVTDHISDLIHAKSIEVDLEYYENSAYYDVLHRAQQEAPYRPAKIVGDLVTVAQNLVSVAGVLVLLMRLNWVIGVVIVAAAIPGALVRLRFSSRLYFWQRDRTLTDRLSWYFHWLLTDGSKAKEIRLFGLGPLFRGRFGELRRQLRRERLRLTLRRSAGDLGSGVVATLAVFGMFAYIAWRAVQGAILVGSLVMYYLAFQTGLTAIQGALSGFAGLYEDNLFLTYYHDFMALERRVLEPEHARTVSRPMCEGIVFDEVTFRYPDTDRVALEGVSLTIRPGEVAALVGANGSGKTTLVKLLCRLYDPQTGAISIDGVDLRELATTDLRRGISVIFQDFAQYQLSARENIWVGNVDLDPEDEAVHAAARAAGADDLIAGLEHGYDQTLGKWFEEGDDLSTGEWQKVALARAFVRDADILVLDEPTSALDPIAEWNVFERIREMAQARAVVLISHRFSTVRNADRIHIMDHGRIVESGSHDELIGIDGRYARMYEVQARAYQV